MSPDALQPALPSGPSARSESVDARLLQERLRLFSGISMLIIAAFGLLALLLVGLGAQPPLPPAARASMLAIVLLLGAAWLYCRRGGKPARTLRLLDAALMLALGTLMLFVPGTAVPEPEARGFVVVLEVSLILYARSIFIPSTAARTLAVSVAAALPLAALSLASEALRFSAWKVAWLLAAIAIVTAGSRVIYGLRKEARHARQLGQYTLEEKLGEGGMGVVYRARHAMLRRPTAVKLLKPERIGEASLRRFEREVQLTAGLSHPNTVTIFDYGRTHDHVFYYAMEYLEGLGLDQLVAADGPQPPGRVVHALRQVLAALSEAHGVGLVHRDVKPANVILCERGGLSDVAKVVDFGLVKDLDAADGTTQEAALVGTPLYMAPEAIRSSAADARADLYSVGAVGYWLLTGTPVFEARTIVEICGHHLHTPPTPPSQRLGRPLPDDLEAWVLACLEKDPTRRPATALEAAERLERCADAGSWTAEQARGWWVAKGRALAAARHAPGAPSLLTSSRPVVERAGAGT